MRSKDKLKLFALRQLPPLLARWHWRGKKETKVEIYDQRLEVAGGHIKLRVYSPKPTGDTPVPALLFFHGGGWVTLDIDTHDGLCRDICVQCGCVVVSVDYRLAPEHPLPTGVNDCLAALAWLKSRLAELNVDPAKIIVGGDSAGGNLAAVVAQQARELYPGLLGGQILIYPVTDFYTSEWPSWQRYGSNKYLFNASTMRFMWDMYVAESELWSEGQTSHPLATPLSVDDLSKLPPALVQIAEVDLLSDEGREYAERMRAAKVPVDKFEYAGQQHGFVGLSPNNEAYRQALADMAAWIRAL